MKRLAAGLLGVSVLVLAPSAFGMSKMMPHSESVKMHAITTAGVGAELGTLRLKDGPGGLIVTPYLKGLPAGSHGFHVHLKPDCGAAEKDGVMTAGQAAGGHFDPAGTGKHEGPMGQGHAGDMPVLMVAADGTASAPVTVPRLTLDQVRGHAIVIHEGGDTYSDTPKPLGGGGTRIACGVVK